jgi:hypothetical protein
VLILKEVPLGVKAVVHGIYEPRQQGQRDCIQVYVPDGDKAVVEAMFARIGLVPVGVIYTYAFILIM